MSKEYSTQESIVAFIDILGSSKAIMEDAQKSLITVHNAYTESMALFKNLFGDRLSAPNVKIFSDNIVIAVPRKGESGHGAFLAVAMMSAIIQVQFLKHELLTRGGIASGSYFADEMMVWGTALVKAHTLENTISIYPRIVIDPELVGELKLADPNTPFVRIKSWIEQDEDKLFMVNYLNEYLANAEIFILGLMQIADRKIIEYHNNLKACQKWLWFINYLNKKLIVDNRTNTNKAEE